MSETSTSSFISFSVSFYHSPLSLSLSPSLLSSNPPFSLTLFLLARSLSERGRWCRCERGCRAQHAPFDTGVPRSSETAPPPRTSIGPWAQSYCRVLRGRGAGAREVAGRSRHRLMHYHIIHCMHYTSYNIHYTLYIIQCTLV